MGAARAWMGIASCIAALSACSDGSEGDGGTTGGAGGQADAANGGQTVGGGGGAGHEETGGTGGTPGAGGKNAADVTSAEDCFHEGGGGANAWYCAAVTIELSEPVAKEGLSILVESSLGDAFAEICVGLAPECGDGGTAWLNAIGDPVEKLVVMTMGPNTFYDPTWVEVELQQGGSVIGSDHLELTGACHAPSGGGDDWCWKADPVTLQVTAAP